MVRRSLSAALGLLAILHAAVLASQAWHGQLADPGLVLRWAVGAGLAVALARRWQRREPIFTARRPVAIWLLAALLHGPAVLDDHVDGRGQAASGRAAVAIQIAAAVTATALGLGLALAWLAFGGRVRGAGVSAWARHTAPGTAARAAVVRLLLAPRAPPAAASFFS